MNNEKLNNKILASGIRPSDVVKMSGSIVSLNQAQQWVDFFKNGRNLSAPVFYMLNRMCDDILNGEARIAEPMLSSERIAAMAIPFDDFIPSGVYFLVKNKSIVYIGKSERVQYRVAQHVRAKDFDSVFVIRAAPSEIDRIEKLYISSVNPALNITGTVGEWEKKAKSYANRNKSETKLMSNLGSDKDGFLLGIAGLRVTNGLSQVELGSLVGLSGQSISNIEMGIHCPSRKNLAKLFVALKADEHVVLDLTKRFEEYRKKKYNK